ncbi:MAG: DUF1648 domain-containing protein [Phycisphaerales bacterium]|nr:DUF1648 domain-containing protein [Phycisphaerales bacterium]
MNIPNVIAVACWIVLLVIWMAAIEEWPALPAKFPMHFDFAGRPDSYVDKRVVAWFLLPMFATVLNLGLTFLVPMIRWMTRKHPEFVNMPRKEQWLKLDSAARLRTLEPVFGAARVLQLILMGLFLFMVVSSAKVASGQWSVLPMWPMFSFLTAIGSSVVWLRFRSVTAVTKEVKVFSDPL